MLQRLHTCASRDGWQLFCKSGPLVKHTVVQVALRSASSLKLFPEEICKSHAPGGIMRPLRMSSDRLQDRTSCECPSSRSTALRCPRSGKSRQMHSGMQMGQLKLRRASSAANWIVVQRGAVQQRPWFALSVKVRPSTPPTGSALD